MNINGLYRQWQLPNPSTLTENTLTFAEQTKRFETILYNWEKSLAEKRETITLTNINLDANYWETPPADQPHHHRILNPMVQMLQDRILTKGVTRITTKDTRYAPGKADSNIDHMYTNRPELITNHKIIDNGASDHRVCLFYRANSKPIAHARYSISRYYTNFSKKLFEEYIVNDPRHIESLQSEDINLVSNNLVNMITDSLQLLAPTRKL
jgi:hypothetical protein